MPKCHLRIFLLMLFCLMKANMLMADNPVKVMTLAIIGAEKTKSWVVLRELNFKRGDIIELEDVEARLEKSRQNIYNLGLFNDVQMKAQVIGDQLHVIIEVKERWFVFGAPILRLEERNSYDIVNTIRERNFRRLVYGMNVSWRNITGRNETLTFSGQLGFSKRLRVNFLRPAMFRKSNVDLRMGYRFINEKEIIVGTEEGQVQWRGTESEPFQVSHEPFIAFQKRISLYENLYFEFNYKWLSFSDSLYVLEIDPSRNNFITELDGKEAYPSFILQYSVDRRDIRRFPLKGFRYQFFGRFTGIKGISTSQFGKLGLTFAHHIPLSKRWNVAYGTHLVLSIGDSIPYFEKNFLGARRREFRDISTTLRGYQPFVIAGSTVNMNKVEIKYGIVPYHIADYSGVGFLPKKWQQAPTALYVTAFYEMGFIRDDSFNNNDDFLKNQLLHGYGVGLNIVGFYDILLRIEYARNHLNQGGVYLHGSVPIK